MKSRKLAIRSCLNSSDKLFMLLTGTVACLAMLQTCFASKNQRFEEITQDDLNILVENPLLKLTEMECTRIIKDRVYAHQRLQGLTPPGSVTRL